MKTAIKKSFWLALTVSAISLAATPALRAETRVAGSTVPVSLVVAGVNTLNSQIKNVSDNANAANVTFPSFSGPQSSWSLVANQYMQLSVDDNSVGWRLRLYSNNFTSQPSTTTWGFQYGGLIGGPGAKIPMAWLLNPNTIPGGPGIGVPANPANSTINGWTFLKDARDVDDPAAAGDSSFVGADAGGYTNIAFGSPAFTRIVRPNLAGGSEALATTTSPFFLYFKGDVSAAPASSYTTNLVLDLINL